MAPRAGAVVLFAGTAAVSALLLFVVQPMVGKMVLPTFGGTPGIWTTCMVFFQTVLLAGYAYAHGLAIWLGPRGLLWVHLIVVLPPLLVLPVWVGADLAPPPTAHPVAWLLGRLTVAVGLPLFVVSSSAPLLQRWYVETGAKDADDPYFLYAASNAGSLAALIGYPLIVEPGLDLSRQSRLWSLGYLVMIGLLAVCAIVVLRSRRGMLASASATGHHPGDGAVPVQRKLRWVLLALVPSSLLLGVTSHITTNVAAVPLFWTVPLALYLLTFIVAFSRRLRATHGWTVAAFPYVALILGPFVLFDTRDLSWLALPPHLLLFFVAALACHGELVRLRPTSERLTGFYMWIAVGGALGGLFNALVAPFAFVGIVEYPLALVASCFLLPQTDTARSGRRRPVLDVLPPLALATVAASAIVVLQLRFAGDRWRGAALLVALTAMACFLLRGRPLRFGLGYATFIGTIALLGSAAPGEQLHAERNFFGVKRVVLDDEGRLRTFVHGTTNHGMQWNDPARRREPTAYYHRQGPIGDVFRALNRDDGLQRAAIVGLGAGGLAPYLKEGQTFTFYEIDPAVERIARDTRLFTYLADCGNACEVVLGDGRLTLARAPDGRFDLIVLDAFSSDAVPTHLLSVEALAVYLEKLADDGALVFNITNAYLDLSSVTGNLAAFAGLVAVHRNDRAAAGEGAGHGRMPTHYVAMARRVADLDGLPTASGWQPLPAAPGRRVWTDQYTDPLGLFRPPRRPQRD